MVLEMDAGCVQGKALQDPAIPASLVFTSKNSLGGLGSSPSWPLQFGKEGNLLREVRAVSRDAGFQRGKWKLLAPESRVRGLRGGETNYSCL